MAEHQWPAGSLEAVEDVLEALDGSDYSVVANGVLAALAEHATSVGYRVVQHPTCSLDEAAAIHDAHVDEEGA